MSLIILDVETSAQALTVTLRFTRADGSALASRTIALGDHAPELWDGLFRTREHLRAVGDRGLLSRLGRFLGQTLLGPEPMGELSRQGDDHTLLVRLPDAASDRLAAAFARVPWELALISPRGPTLGERGVAVRLDLHQASPDVSPLQLQSDGPLRVLMVWALPRHARPRAARQHRRHLLDALRTQVGDDRQIIVHSLQHHVTRERLLGTWERAGGYTVLHWTGLNPHDLLTLAGVDGRPERVSGAGLVHMLREAGGVPELVCLHTLRSTSLVHARDWETLHRGLLEESDALAPAPPASLDLHDALQGGPGTTATALSMRAAGVAQVLATRGPMADELGHRLGGRFLTYLLAGKGGAERSPMGAEDALLGAIEDLRRDVHGGSLSDYLSPVLVGARPLRLVPPPGPSEQRWSPAPPISAPALTPSTGFIGRDLDLDRLAERWLPGAGGPPIALLQGPAGMGKTALAAELIHLWHGRFDVVLPFQVGRSGALSSDAFSAQLHRRLLAASEPYRQRVERDPQAAIHLPSAADDAARRGQMRANLAQALTLVSTLVVIEDFDGALQDELIGGPGTDLDSNSAYASVDPEWDRILLTLGGLGDVASRVLITSQRRPVALVEPAACLWLPTGPLPLVEGGLILQSARGYRRLLEGSPTDQLLARRAVEASRGHPLLLQLFSRLTADPGALFAAVGAVEGAAPAWLPDVYRGPASREEWQTEHDHLNRVVGRVLPLLIERVGPSARRLLWMVTRSEVPLAEGMIGALWSAGSTEKTRLREMKTMVDSFPPEMRGSIPGMTPLMLRLLEKLDPSRLQDDTEDLSPLLDRLRQVGLLVDRQGQGGVREWGAHALVREHVDAWMVAHPNDQGDRTATEVLESMGDFYMGAFRARLQSDEPGAIERAARVGRLGLSCLLRAQSWERIGGLIGELISGAGTPQRLDTVLAELVGVIDTLPQGASTWRVQTLIADALRKGQRPQKASPLYARAEATARAQGAWDDVAAIAGNHAQALVGSGQIEAAQAALQRAADAFRAGGHAEVEALSTEAEVQRLVVMGGQASAARPAIQAIVDTMTGWWEASLAGQEVPQAPVQGELGQALLRVLDTARQADLGTERWESALDRLDQTEAIQQALGFERAQLTRSRFHRYGPLVRLGRLDQAATVLESCRRAWREAGDHLAESDAVSALARVWFERADVDRAVSTEEEALAIRTEHGELSHRAISHRTLADYLEHRGDADRGRRHRVADIVYSVVIGDRVAVSTTLHRIAIDAQHAGGLYHLPTLAEVLAQDEFRPLRRQLDEAKADLLQLQQMLEGLVEQSAGFGDV